MSPVSSTVTTGMTATAQQYNDLREDAISKVRENHIPLLVHGTAKPAMATDAYNLIHSPLDYVYFPDLSIHEGGTLMLHGSLSWDYALGTVASGVAGTLLLYDETGGTPLTDQYYEWVDTGVSGDSPAGVAFFSAFTVTALPGSAFRLGVRARRTLGGASAMTTYGLGIIIRK